MKAHHATISNAEWEVMRIVWAKGSATSAAICTQLADSHEWKKATVKTLLRRLVDKKYLATKKAGRAFIYFSTVDEQTTINAQMLAAMDKVCQMHHGQTLAYVIDNTTFTQADIKLLIEHLQEKQKTAPKTLPCNCLHDDCCTSCQAGKPQFCPKCSKMLAKQDAKCQDDSCNVDNAAANHVAS